MTPAELGVLEASAFDLAGLVRRGELSPVELVDAHIARMEEVEPSLNAVFEARFEAARKEAAGATEALTKTKAKDLGPLHGVPCTVKDFVAVEGMPQTAGVLARRQHRAAADATVVARLRAAGAIVTATTNAAEGGLWMETDNPIRGRTLNPWDPSRSPGGSSGGEAALIASGASPFGVAADIGGSIRIPAAFCGIVGHKPSGRLVPTTGHWPAPAGDALGLLCVGPLARRVKDLAPLLELMAGPDGTDPVARAFDLALPAAAADPRRLKVRVLEGRGMPPASADLRRGVERAAEALERRGAEIVPTPAKRFRWAALLWGARLLNDPGESYAEILGDGTPFSVSKELWRIARGRRRHTLPAVVTVLSERLEPLLPGSLRRLEVEAAALKEEVKELLGDDSVLLNPPYSRVAPRHGAALLTPLHFAHTGLFNVLELPSTSVPCGFDAKGLPLGLQVAAGPGQDRLSIAVAAMLEEDLGGWVRAEPHNRRSAPLGLRRSEQ